MLLHVVTVMTVHILLLHSYMLGMCGVRWGGEDTLKKNTSLLHHISYCLTHFTNKHGTFPLVLP
jgi:hypothetical protein